MSGLERGEEIWIFEREEKWKRWREMIEKEKRALNNVIRVESRRTVDRVGRPRKPESSDKQSGRPGRSTQKSREH